MPNDRGNSSLLQQASLSKYKTLNKFLQLTSDLQVSTGETAGVLDSQQALDLLNQAIDETTDKATDKTQGLASSPSTSRQKELSLSSDMSPVDQTEQAKAPEQAESLAQSEIAELGQEIAEVGKEAKEQRDQEELKAQQAAINELAAQVATPVTDIKPVVVLPISEEKQQQAKFKSTHFSLRWLAEWARKISKIFSGAVIYKEELANSEDS